MKTIYLLYETDEWLTYASNSLLGVFSNPRAIKSKLRKYLAKRVDEFIDKAQYNSGATRPIGKRKAINVVMDELFKNNQTFGYTFNYVIETKTINEID